MPEVDLELLTELRRQLLERTGQPLLQIAQPYTTESLIRAFTKGRNELLELVANLDDVQVSFQPAPGEYSINEVITHMIAAQGGVYNALLDLAHLVLPMIGNVAHGPGGGAQNNLTASQVNQQLRESTEEMLFMIREAARVETPVVRNYPGFGDMSAKSWILFLITHDFDHKHQVQAIITSANFPQRDSYMVHA